MKKSLLKYCLRIAQKRNPKFDSRMFFRHWSFIIQDNVLLDWGCNRFGALQHEMKKIGYSEQQQIHSENDAYDKSSGLLDKRRPFEIVNVRLNKTGIIRLSKPCPHCFFYLKILGCRKIYYSTDEGVFEKLTV